MNEKPFAEDFTFAHSNELYFIIDASGKYKSNLVSGDEANVYINFKHANGVFYEVVEFLSNSEIKAMLKP